MDVSFFEQLLHRGLINEAEFEKVKADEAHQQVSVHWDIRILLYAGIFLLMTGLSIVVYKNIETIGHAAILAFILVCCLACFFYCLKNSKGFSGQKIEPPNIWFDYVLLLGCLLLLTFIGYIQYQYTIFGNRWGMATFIPMVLLFVSAYYFDHIGVLSLAITNLAAWIGIVVTPMQLLKAIDFSSDVIIYSGLLLGATLTIISYFTLSKNIKAHFSFTYKNFGLNIFFIFCIAAMFHFTPYYFLWFLLLAGVGFLSFKNALQENSFYFLLVTILYGYAGLSFVIVKLLSPLQHPGKDYLIMFYFIASGIAVIWILIYLNKILFKNERL
jgi:hypothetical protein